MKTLANSVIFEGSSTVTINLYYTANILVLNSLMILVLNKTLKITNAVSSLGKFHKIIIHDRSKCILNLFCNGITTVSAIAV